MAEKTALRVTQRRLRQFVDARLLRRIQQPIFPDEQGGSKPYLYTLDYDGARLVSETLRIDLRPRDWKPSQSERNLLFMEHRWP